MQDWKIRLKVQSRVGGLGWGCGPGRNDQAEGVVQSRKHKLRVWSRAGGLG